jgi:phosphoglycolate phosphatase-like HAD superfamily hydrolase
MAARVRPAPSYRFSGAQTIIIGDTLLDVATGKKASAKVVAVATGWPSAAESLAAGAGGGPAGSAAQRPSRALSR